MDRGVAGLSAEPLTRAAICGDESWPTIWPAALEHEGEPAFFSALLAADAAHNKRLRRAPSRQPGRRAC
jgi:hypothetical protein